MDVKFLKFKHKSRQSGGLDDSTWPGTNSTQIQNLGLRDNFRLEIVLFGWNIM